MQRRRATLSYVTALVIYGTIAWPLSYINVPSEVVVLFRGLLGAIFIWGVMLLRHHRFDRATVQTNIGWLVLSGICLGLNWVFLFAAYRSISAAVASLCNYMAPVILIVVAPWVLGEPRNGKKMVCAAIAVLGMVMVSGVLEGGAEYVNATGIAFALAAALGFAGVVLCNKKMGEGPVYEKAIIQLICAMLTALPFVLANNWGIALQPDTLSIALIIMLGFVHTGFAYCLYFSALGTLSAQTIAVLGYIEPAVAVLVSTLIMLQPLSLMGWIGAILILGAATASELF